MTLSYTKRTFNLIEPRSDEVVALLGRRAARETGSGEFQLHGNTEATTSWQGVRLWGSGLLDERMDELAWKGTAESGFSSLSAGLWVATLSFPFSGASYCDWRSIDSTFQDYKKKSILMANRFLKHIFSNAKELTIDCFSFFVIIWFDGRIDESAGGIQARWFQSWFPRWTLLQSSLEAWLAVAGLPSVNALNPLSLGLNVYK